LNVLHIGKYFSPFSGGLENYMRDAMTALQRQGVKCAALVHRHALSVQTTSETITSGDQSFRVVRAAVWGRLLFTPLSPTFPLHLARLIKRFKPDILHLHLPNPSAFWVLTLPAARRRPWVVHWHADIVTAAQGWGMRLFYRLYQPFEQSLLRRASAVIVTSPPYLEASVPLRLWRNKCHVVPLGVDTERLDAALAADQTCTGRRLRPDDGRRDGSLLRILAVGRQTYYKGFHYLIEATALFTGMRVDFVGSGDQAAELRTLAASLGVDGRVSFYGNLGDAELLRHMQGCDCLCLPSIERTEAFGLVLLEAMYLGKATVVSDVPGSGMGWVVEDGVTGIKLPPADAKALAGAFADLAGDRDKLVRLGDNGRTRFTREFDIGRGAEQLVRIYQDTLRQTGADQRDVSAR
jgi:rhamnosyl/mannosyltransferase